MEKTMSYYIIETEKEKHLHFEQTGDRDLEVYELSEPLEAFGFNTEEEAQKEIDNINNRTGHWNYYGDFSKPVKPVKFTVSYKLER